MKRDPGRISSFTFYPCMRKSHSKYPLPDYPQRIPHRNLLIPEEFQS
jgi:hypothetical protein